MNYTVSNFQWTGRADTKPAERMYQSVQLIDLNQTTPEKGLVLLGFASDEGVKRNLGRPGAAEGPDAIRSKLGGLAKHTFTETLYDAGNINVFNNDLETAQNALAEYVTKLHNCKNKVILLGGGHEIAWPHYKGLLAAYPNKRIGIVNFDAHFDLRKPQNNQGSSGTPFWQAQALSPAQFHYYVLGIQPYANTKSLFETAKAYGVQYHLQEDIQPHTLHTIQHDLGNFIESVDLIYLTICLDVFDISIAPGVSAPNTNGLSLDIVQPLIEQLLISDKCCSIDIAELAPCHDEQEKTARLAAWLCHYVIEKGFS